MVGPGVFNILINKITDPELFHAIEGLSPTFQIIVQISKFPYVDR